PTASMYCAVLNHTLIGGFRRTKASTVSAVRPLTSIAQGRSSIATEAKNGIKTTEVLTLANGILKKNESLMMLRIAKATNAFQKRDGNAPGLCQSADMSKPTDRTVTTPTNTYMRRRRIRSIK